MDEFPEMPNVPEEIWEELERLRIFQEALCGAPLKTIDMRVSYRIRPLDSFKTPEEKEKPDENR